MRASRPKTIVHATSTEEKVKVQADTGRCRGHTLCSMIAPKSFVFNDVDGNASVVAKDVPQEYEGRVHEAAQSCPGPAIVINGIQ
jgi:ferredoxin